MAFEKVEGQTWKPENPNDEITGIFIGVQNDVGSNKSNLYSLEVDNKPWSVWGSAVLDPKMVGAKPGDLIKIVYLGKGEAKPGKNAPKLFEVFIDYEFRNKQASGPAKPNEPEVGKPIPAVSPKVIGSFQG